MDLSRHVSVEAKRELKNDGPQSRPLMARLWSVLFAYFSARLSNTANQIQEEADIPFLHMSQLLDRSLHQCRIVLSRIKELGQGQNCIHA